jgi:hypothetical protein
MSQRTINVPVMLRYAASIRGVPWAAAAAFKRRRSSNVGAHEQDVAALGPSCGSASSVHDRRLDDDESIHGPELFGKWGARGWPSIVRFEHLAVQVGRHKLAAVSDDQVSDTGHGQHQRGRTSHAARARDKRGGLLEPQLAFQRQNAGTQLPRVPLPFFGAQLTRLTGPGRS